MSNTMSFQAVSSPARQVRRTSSSLPTRSSSAVNNLSARSAHSTFRLQRLSAIKSATHSRQCGNVKIYSSLESFESQAISMDVKDQNQDYSDAVSSWEDLSSMQSLAYAMNNSTGDQNVAYRLQAAAELGPMTTYDTMQQTGVVDMFGDKLEGCLWDASTIVDNHYRMLKDCMIQGDYSLVDDVYHNLANVPPVLPPEQIDTIADAAYRALLCVREEPDFVTSMLAESMDAPATDLDFETEREMQQDFYRAKALINAIDSVIEKLPIETNDYKD